MACKARWRHGRQIYPARGIVRLYFAIQNPSGGLISGTLVNGITDKILVDKCCLSTIKSYSMLLMKIWLEEATLKDIKGKKNENVVIIYFPRAIVSHHISLLL